MKIYVEGGGDAASLKAECRKGFAEFLEKADLKDPVNQVSWPVGAVMTRSTRLLQRSAMEKKRCYWLTVKFTFNHVIKQESQTNGNPGTI